MPSIEAMTTTFAPSLIMFWTWLFCWSCLLSAYWRLVLKPASPRSFSRLAPSRFQRSRLLVGIAMPMSAPAAPPPVALPLEVGFAEPDDVGVLVPPRSPLQAASVPTATAATDMESRLRREICMGVSLLVTTASPMCRCRPWPPGFVATNYLTMGASQARNGHKPITIP
nr:hypothetical protein [Tessaracoccus defluvii]